MGFFRKFALCMCLVMMLQLFVAPVSAEEDMVDASVQNGCRGIDSTVPYLSEVVDIENAQSVFVMESGTDTLMYAQNPDQQLHPAGMVKIMTALLTIENGDLSDIVTVKNEVLSSVSDDARTSKLQVNEVLTVEQLLYCVLVEGSNDGAAVLADHIAGDQSSFVAMMNKRAEEIGCTNTVFTNVHGLHDENQLSSARDIARILDVAIENEQFRLMFGTTHYTVEKTNKSDARSLESSNHMMHEGMYEIYYDERVTGGRTGVNNTGLRCIASTSAQDDVELICVIMGSESKINDRGIVELIGGFKETQQLMDAAFSNTATGQILYANQALKQCKVMNGSADVVIGPAVEISAVVPADLRANSLTYRYIDVPNAFTAPIEKGQLMSKLEIWCGSVCIAQADLFALSDVSVNSQQIIRKEKAGLPGWAIFLIIIAVVAVLAFVILYVLRVRNIRKRKQIRTRKRRKEI